MESTTAGSGEEQENQVWVERQKVCTDTYRTRMHACGIQA